MLIEPDDPARPDVMALLEEHLRDMHALSPPESVHALDVSGLRRPGITFWSVRDAGTLLGCGALKELDATHGEVKSMRTPASLRRRGAGRAVLAHIVEEARRRGYRRLSLETGSMEAFRPAWRLYERFGFRYCGPFADYRPDPNSVFMTLELAPMRSDDPPGSSEARTVSAGVTAPAVSIHVVGRANASLLDRVDEDVFDHDVQPALLDAFLANPANLLVVAVVEDRVVGMASGIGYVHPDKPLALFINEVGVSGRFQRQGIGRQLVSRMLEKGRELGCAEAWVATERGNAPARALYEALGGVADDEHAVVYVYPLAAEADARSDLPRPADPPEQGR